MTTWILIGAGVTASILTFGVGYLLGYIQHVDEPRLAVERRRCLGAGEVSRRTNLIQRARLLSLDVTAGRDPSREYIASTIEELAEELAREIA